MSIALNDAPTMSALNLNPAQRPHGLLSALTDVSSPDTQWIYGGIDLEIICGGAGTTTAFCLPRDGETPAEKEPFSNEWPHLTPFAMYALHECSAIGKPESERATDAMAALNLGEQTALEAAFVAAVTPDSETTEETAADTEAALIAAENLTGYDAGKIIHVTPGTVILLGDHLKSTDDGLVTKNGTLVVSGLGYVGSDLNDGDVLVTGPVFGASGEAFTTETVLDRPTNLLSVLAEKPWALGHACGAHLIAATPAP